MEREEIIQNLVVESFHDIMEQRRTSWLLHILEHGFPGFSHLGDRELSKEAERYGISAKQAAAAAAVEATWIDDDFGDEREIVWPLFGRQRNHPEPIDVD